eukprot:81390_1
MYRLLNELGLAEVLNQCMKCNGVAKLIDYFMIELQTRKEHITNKNKFWDQIGFKIKNGNSKLISVISRHSLLMENSTYEQGDKQVKSTILSRLVNELGLMEVLNQCMKLNGAKLIDYFMTELQTREEAITNKHEFWHQIGFEIKNAKSKLISVISTHSLLMENSTYEQNDKQVKSTILYRLLNELGLREVLNQCMKIHGAAKLIDYFMMELQMRKERITNKNTFWHQIGFEIKNDNNKLISVISRHSLLLQHSTYEQDDKQVKSTILYRLLNELELREVLNQYMKIQGAAKLIDYFMMELQMRKERITNKNTFWHQIGFEIKN